MTEKGMPKIVLTGGPGGGKTTALDLFRREFVNEIVVVPESATMIFGGGIHRSEDKDVIMATQKTIFQLQKNLEIIQNKIHPDRLILCDRGTLDGLAYWPGEKEDYFSVVGSDFETEIYEYDAVIFFETAAASKKPISSNNPIRTENEKQAIILDQKLQTIWSQHPNYHFVGSNESFIEKINFGINTIKCVIEKYKSN